MIGSQRQAPRHAVARACAFGVALGLAACGEDARPELPEAPEARHVTPEEAIGLARRAVAASALVGIYASIEVDSGRLIVRTTSDGRRFWGFMGCSAQTRMLGGLYEHWNSTHPDASAVELISNAGKVLGKFPAAPDQVCD